MLVNFEGRFTDSVGRKEIIPEARRYPPEIDLFASEGFLQSFLKIMRMIVLTSIC